MRDVLIVARGFNPLFSFFLFSSPPARAPSVVCSRIESLSADVGARNVHSDGGNDAHPDRGATLAKIRQSFRVGSGPVRPALVARTGGRTRVRLIRVPHCAAVSYRHVCRHRIRTHARAVDRFVGRRNARRAKRAEGETRGG